MAAESELERLVVRVLMEASSFTNGMKPVLESLASLQTEAAEVARGVERQMQAISASVATMAERVGASVAQANLALAPITNFAIAAKNTVDAVGLLANVDLKNLSTGLQASARSATLLAEKASTLSGMMQTITHANSSFGNIATPFAAMEQGLDKLDTAVDRFAKLSVPFKKLSTAMAGLEDASARLDAVGQRIVGLGTNFKAFQTGMGEDFNKTVNNVNGLSRAIEALKESSIRVGMAGTRIEKLVKPLTELAAPMAALDGAGDTLKKIATGIDKISKLDLEPWKKANTAIGSLGTAMAKLNTGLTGMPSLAAFASDLANSGSQVTAAAGQFKGAGTALKQFALDMPDAAALAPVVDVRKVLNSLGNAMGKLGTQTGNLTTFATPLKTFIGEIGTLASGITVPMRTLAAAFNSIARLAESVVNFNPGDMTKLSTSLARFMPDFEKMANQFATPAVEMASKSLAKIGTFVNSVAEFNKIKIGDMGKRFDAVGTGVEGMLTKLAAPTNLVGIEATSNALERVGAFTRSLAKTNIANLKPLTKGIGDLLVDLSNAPAGAALDSAKVLTRVNTALTNMAGVNPNQVLATANAARSAMTIINSMPVAPGAMQAANVLHRLGLAMKNMAAAGGGGGIPPSFNFGGVTGPGPGGFNSFSNQASRATGSANRFGQALKNMFAASDTAGFVGLQRIQTSLLGLGILGIVQFARMDDELNKVMAHMGLFDAKERAPVRAEMQKGILDLSTRTATGPADLAKGLDKLTSSGMNAAMAMSALAYTEDFAMASGMKMEKASTKLVDIMGATGLAVEDPTQHILNMIGLSDKFVHMASKVGSTELQLTEAFTGRFTTMMKDTKTTLDDAFILLGTYSKIDESLRGSAGGTRVSRALASLGKMANSPTPQWMSMMGGEQFDSKGKMKSAVEIMEIMGKKLSAEPGRRLAQLGPSGLGFDLDAIQALEPLLQNTKGFALLREELSKSAGAAKNVADMYRQGLLNQMKMLFNSASAIATVFGDRLAPGLYLITSGFQSLAQAFIALNPAYQSLIVYSSLLLLTFRPTMGMLAGIGSFILGSLLSPFRLVYNLIMSIGSAFVYVWETAREAGMLIWSTLKMVGTAAYNTGYGIYYAFAFAWRAIDKAGDAIGYIFSLMVMGGKAIGAMVMNMTAAFGSLFTAVFSIVSVLVAVVAMFVLAGPLMLLFAAGFAAIGAVAVTVTMALGQLAALIGAGLVAAWGAFKAAAVGAIGWIGGSVVQINNNIRGMWQDLQEGTGHFIQTTAASLTLIAGFFWNFRENVSVIWKWLGEHGQEAFEDVAKAAFRAFEILAGNLWSLMGAIGTTIQMTLTTAFGAVWGYLRTFFGWFARQWPNMVLDMGVVMAGFLSGLKQNFVQLFDLLGGLVQTFVDQIKLSMSTASLGYTTAQYGRYAEYKADTMRDLFREGALPGMDREGLQKHIEGIYKAAGNRTLLIDSDKMSMLDERFFQQKRAGIIEKNFNNFKPVGVDTTGMKFSTDFGQLGEGMSLRSGVVGQSFELLGNVIPKVFKDSFKDMLPFSDAFTHIADSPTWQKLLDPKTGLNLNLPTDAWSQMEKFVKRGLGGDSEGVMGPAIAPGKGPMQFKQISLERMMTGGPDVESLEYKTMMYTQQIAGNTAKIAQAMTANDAGPPKGREKLAELDE